MWTDTAEFRNPEYHAAGDRPETLDCDFMTDVARLLVFAACEGLPAAARGPR